MEYNIEYNEIMGYWELKIYHLCHDKIYPVDWIDIPYTHEDKSMVETHRVRNYPDMKIYFKKI